MATELAAHRLALVASSNPADTMAKSKKQRPTARPKARLPKGLQDTASAELRGLDQLLRKIREVYELYGFQPLDTPAIEYTQLADFSQPGLEVGATAKLRLTGFATYETGLAAFLAFNGDGGIMVDWDNTLSVRLTRAVSLNYRANVGRNPWITNRLMIRQGAFVRFALNVL